MEERQQKQGEVVCTVLSPMDGMVVSLKDVPDPGFSSGFIGDGVAIMPKTGKFFAPASGRIVSVFETKHAILIENEQHVRVFIHAGIGSMRVQGRGFTAYVTDGQAVKAGERILTVSFDRIKGILDSMVSPVVISDMEDDCSVRIIARGQVSVGDPLFEVIRIREK